MDGIFKSANSENREIFIGGISQIANTNGEIETNFIDWLKKTTHTRNEQEGRKKKTQ